MTDFLNLGGKVALVTGGNRGIGRAIAEGFAREGASVAIVCRDTESGQQVATSLSEAYGTRVVQVTADLAQPDDITRLVEETLAACGRIDVLVNNAGVINRDAALDASLEAYDELMDINLRGAWLLAQAAGRHMRARGGGGKIVNMSSMHDTLGYPNRSLYAMSKAGLSQLSRTLAIEWAADNIQVNAVAPGATHTDMVTQLERNNPAAYQAMVGAIPAGRLATPEDIANTVLFLSSEAADYITGHTLYIDGGWSIA